MAADRPTAATDGGASTGTIVGLSIWLRLFTAGLAFLCNILFGLPQPEPFTVYSDTHKFWDTFARFDSGWYFGIARNGYQYVEGGRERRDYSLTPHGRRELEAETRRPERAARTVLRRLRATAVAQ